MPGFSLLPVPANLLLPDFLKFPIPVWRCHKESVPAFFVLPPLLLPVDADFQPPLLLQVRPAPVPAAEPFLFLLPQPEVPRLKSAAVLPCRHCMPLLPKHRLPRLFHSFLQKVPPLFLPLLLLPPLQAAVR